MGDFTESRSTRTVATKSAESSATARDSDERAAAWQLENSTADIAATGNNKRLTERTDYGQAPHVQGRALKLSYQHADDVTAQAAIAEPNKLRDLAGNDEAETA